MTNQLEKPGTGAQGQTVLQPAPQGAPGGDVPPPGTGETPPGIILILRAFHGLIIFAAAVISVWAMAEGGWAVLALIVTVPVLVASGCCLLGTIRSLWWLGAVASLIAVCLCLWVLTQTFAGGSPLLGILVYGGSAYALFSGRQDALHGSRTGGAPQTPFCVTLFALFCAGIVVWELWPYLQRVGYDIFRGRSLYLLLGSSLRYWVFFVSTLAFSALALYFLFRRKRNALLIVLGAWSVFCFARLVLAAPQAISDFDSVLHVYFLVFLIRIVVPVLFFRYLLVSERAARYFGPGDVQDKKRFSRAFLCGGAALFVVTLPFLWRIGAQDALFHAIRSGNEAAVHTAIFLGGNPSKKGLSEKTPLEYALSYPRRPKPVTALIEAGAVPDAATLRTVLTQYANSREPSVRAGYLDLLTKVLPKGGDLTAEAFTYVRTNPEVPELAARSADVQLWNLLVEAGMPVDTAQPLLFAVLRYRGKSAPMFERLLALGFSRAKHGGRTLLVAAIAAGKAEEALMLLKDGANPNEADDNGVTPVVANAECLPGVLPALLAGGADVRAGTGEKAPLYAYAFQARDAKPECIRQLLDAGARLEARDANGVPLLLFAAREKPNVIPALLTAGLEADIRNAEGENALVTLLSGTITSSRVDYAIMLLEKGASPNARLAKNGNTALHIYAKKRWVSNKEQALAEVLLAKADREAKNTAGDTPLLASLRESRDAPDLGEKADERMSRTAYPVQRALLDKGANRNAVDNDGNNAVLIYLKERGKRLDVTVLNRLIALGIDVKARDKKGRTALMCLYFGKEGDRYASSKRMAEVEAALIKAGVDPAAKDADGKTLADYKREHTAKAE